MTELKRLLKEKEELEKQIELAQQALLLETPLPSLNLLNSTDLKAALRTFLYSLFPQKEHFVFDYEVEHEVLYISVEDCYGHFNQTIYLAFYLDRYEVDFSIMNEYFGSTRVTDLVEAPHGPGYVVYHLEQGTREEQEPLKLFFTSSPESRLSLKTQEDLYTLQQSLDFYCKEMESKIRASLLGHISLY